MAGCPSKLTLASFKTGDLPEDERESMVAHLDDCAACREAIEALDANVVRYESKRQAHLENLMAQIEKEKKKPNESGRYIPILPRGRFSVFGGLAAAVVAVILIFVFVSTPKSAVEPEAVQFKGRVSLEVVAKRQKRQFRVSEGTRLIKNDALRFVVTTASAGYLHLFSVDARGKVSSFYPESDPGADPNPMPILTSGRHELPGSVILDDAVGRERFVLIFSREPFDRAEVLKLMTDGEDAAEGAKDKKFKNQLDIQILSITKEKKAEP